MFLSALFFGPLEGFTAFHCIFDVRVGGLVSGTGFTVEAQKLETQWPQSLRKCIGNPSTIWP